MEFKFFIGVDVSKETLDVALLDARQHEQINHVQISNDEESISQLVQGLESANGFDLKQTLFCMEHTGLYNYPLLNFISTHQLNVWVENSVEIKQSMGLQRGKNDRIDAKRIAKYAFKNTDKLRLWQPSRQVVDTLRHLNALRDRLVETKKRLLVPVEEFKEYGDAAMTKLLEKAMAKSVNAINSDLEKLEKQIKKIIDDDNDLKQLYALITSVVGIGFATAVNLIIYTNEFKLFSSVRKLACYCGVAPFEHRSGKSINGRTRLSHFANKKLKTNLHMGSLTSVKLDDGLRKYYERKVAEGKNKMSVLNAVRNKLLARVFAVVKRGTPYEKNYSFNNLVLS